MARFLWSVPPPVISAVHESHRRIGELLGDAVEACKIARANTLRLTLGGVQVLRRIQAAQREWADSLGKEIGDSKLREAGVFWVGF